VRKIRLHTPMKGGKNTIVIKWSIDSIGLISSAFLLVDLWS